MSGNSYNGFTWAERQRAYTWLKRQWAEGKRTKVGACCDVCRQTAGHLMAHSEDYSAPYGDHIGQWTLCYWCHMLLHCRFRASEAFERYVDVLEGGERFVNVPRAEWHSVQAFLSGRRSPLAKQQGAFWTTRLASCSPKGPLRLRTAINSENVCLENPMRRTCSDKRRVASCQLRTSAIISGNHEHSGHFGSRGDLRSCRRAFCFSAGAAADR